MARITHATQIDLRFGDSACELLQFGISVCPSNLAGKCFDPEGVHARAGTGEELLDQRDGVWFVPHVSWDEVFRLLVPRTLQNVVHMQAGAIEDVIDLVDSVRFIPRTLMRQLLRILRPV